MIRQPGFGLPTNLGKARQNLTRPYLRHMCGTSISIPPPIVGLSRAAGSWGYTNVPHVGCIPVSYSIYTENNSHTGATRLCCLRVYHIRYTKIAKHITNSTFDTPKLQKTTKQPTRTRHLKPQHMYCIRFIC
jgi:hypothetical protein